MAENIPIIPIVLGFKSDQNAALKELAKTLNVAQDKLNGKPLKYTLTGDKAQFEEMVTAISKLGLGKIKLEFDTTGVDRLKKYVEQDGKSIGESFSSSINKSFKTRDIEKKVKDIIVNTTGKSEDRAKITSARTLEDTARTLGKTVFNKKGFNEALNVGDINGILKYISACEDLAIILKQIDKLGKGSSLNEKIFTLPNLQKNVEEAFNSTNASNVISNFIKQYEQKISNLETYLSNALGDAWNDIDSSAKVTLNNLKLQLKSIESEIDRFQNALNDADFKKLKENINNTFNNMNPSSDLDNKNLANLIKEYVSLGGNFNNLSKSIRDYYNSFKDDSYLKEFYIDAQNIEKVSEKLLNLESKKGFLKKEIANYPSTPSSLQSSNNSPTSPVDTNDITSQNKLQTELKETANDFNNVTKNAKEAAVAIDNVGAPSITATSGDTIPTENIASMDGSTSSQEVTDLNLIAEAANKVKAAIDSKTTSIVLEEQQMRQSASKEVQSLLAIIEKVDLLTTEISNLANIKLPEIKLDFLNGNGEASSIIESLKSLEGISNNSNISSFISSFSNLANSLQIIKDNFSSLDNLNQLSISKASVTNFESLSNALIKLKDSLKDLPDGANDFLTSIKEISKQSESLKNLSIVLKSAPKSLEKLSKEIEDASNTDTKEIFDMKPLEESLKNIGKYQLSIEKLKGDKSKSAELEYFNKLLEQEVSIYTELYKTASSSKNFDQSEYNEKALAIQKEIEISKELIRIRKQDKETEQQSKQNTSDEESLAAIKRQIDALRARAEAYKSVNSKLFKSVDPNAQNLVNEFNKFLNTLDLTESQLNDIKKGISTTFGGKSIKETYYATKNLSGEFSTLRNEIKSSGFAAKSLGDLLKESFSNLGRYFFGAGMIQELQQGVRQIYENVRNYDESVVNLQIASGKAKDEVSSLMSSYNNMAKTLGATTKEMADSADTWLRQGYSLKETNELIEASLVQSKLGQLESAESTKYLTSALKGYKVEVEDALNVVDKMSAVDLEAAVSLGGLAEAMAETANSARIAGISMDKLLGYEAVIGEVTQDAMSSVGNSLKRIFSRMGNVKAGKFVDDEGEDISNVEKVLGKLGIKLRDTKDEFRNFGDVLDEIADNWNTFTSVEQRAIVTALAGATQAEKLLVLLENYGDAIKYTETAMGASGTAMEKFGAYQEGIEAKTKRLQASFEGLSNTFLSSDFAKGGLDFLSSLLSGLDGLIEKLGTVGTLATIGSGVLGAKGLGLT